MFESLSFEQCIIMILAANAVFTWGVVLWIWKRLISTSLIVEAIGNLSKFTTDQVVGKIKQISEFRR